MKRVIKIEDIYGMNMDKYQLEEEYMNWGIYNHITPSGFKTNHHYLITYGERKIVCQSFNNICKEELLDAIDNYNETGKLGLNAVLRQGVYYVHSSGDAKL